jgi:hypothetical protein
MIVLKFFYDSSLESSLNWNKIKSKQRANKTSITGEITHYDETADVREMGIQRDLSFHKF